MTNQVSAESLSPFSHNQATVITTELLAQLYGTETNNIKVNFTRNMDRFVCGKHYFKLEGVELREFKNKVTQSNLVASRAKHLILWTERGAARHAKMLETDQAWEVFERLEDCYFNQAKQNAVVPALDMLNIDLNNFDLHHIIRDGKVTYVKLHKAGELATAEELLELLKMKGWLVMPKEELAGKLAAL